MMKTLFLWMGCVLAGITLAGALPVSAQERKPPLIEKIEELTGLSVTQAQREAIAEASQAMIRAMWRCQKAFVAALKERGTIPTLAEEALTPVEGLPFDFDQDALEVITEYAAEPPDQIDRDTIRYLEREKDRGIDAIRAEYATALSGLTDLPAFMIMDILDPPPEKPREEGAVRFP